MNIVASDSVNGKMTLSLKDVPWDQALGFHGNAARGLDMRRQGNIINIAPREEIAESRQSHLARRKKKSKSWGRFSLETFQLKYKNVEESAKFCALMKTAPVAAADRNTLLSSRGSALIDPATNTLIITDNRAVIQKFQKLIEELDVAAPPSDGGSAHC